MRTAFITLLLACITARSDVIVGGNVRMGGNVVLQTTNWSSGNVANTPTNLVAWWKLEDTADCASGHTNTLTFNNSTSVVAAQCANGIQVASASSQSATVTGLTGIDGQTHLTMTGWIKRSSTSDNNAFGKDCNNAGGGNIQVTIIGSTVYFVVSPSSGYFYRTANSVADTSLHHFAMVWDATQAAPDGVRAYIDGSEVSYTGSSGSQPATTGTAAGTFYVGKDASNSLFSNGTFDQIQVFNYSMTGPQVATNFLDTCTYTCAP